MIPGALKIYCYLGVRPYCFFYRNELLNFYFNSGINYKSIQGRINILKNRI